MSRRWRLRIRLVGAVLLLVAAGWIVLSGGDPRGLRVPGSPGVGSSTLQPADGSTPDSGLERIPESDLPPEGRETLELIHDGGPFPYERDGITFENREGILPQQPGGYYSEYTVPTPGLDHRGAKRIVCGDAMDCYYTEDHYASFAQIEEGQ